MTARAQVELPVIRYKPSGYSVGMCADGEGRYVDYFDYAALATRLAESEARLRAAETRDKLRARAIDRWVPCPDHRDKTEAGVCQVCRAERAEARAEGLLEAVRMMHAADAAYGCGFYNQSDWLEAYELTAKLAGIAAIAQEAEREAASG